MGLSEKVTWNRMEGDEVVSVDIWRRHMQCKGPEAGAPWKV